MTTIRPGVKTFKAQCYRQGCVMQSSKHYLVGLFGYGASRSRRFMSYRVCGLHVPDIEVAFQDQQDMFHVISAHPFQPACGMSERQWVLEQNHCYETREQNLLPWGFDGTKTYSYFHLRDVGMPGSVSG